MKLKTITTTLACAIAWATAVSQTGNPPAWDIYPDTWVATDGAGRVEPTQAEAGKPKTDKPREVGIFYVTWHNEGLYNMPAPYDGDVTKVLERDPSARLDGNSKSWTVSSFHWGEPEMGYFLSADPYVIRHDVSMLADAGVDVLILDVTNGVRYWNAWEALWKVMSEMKADGNKVPKFCFWSFNGNMILSVQELYDKVYKDGRYKDLWYYRDGKPLLLYNANPTCDANGAGYKGHDNYLYDPDAVTNPANPHYGDTLYTRKQLTYYPKYITDFFSLRNMWWGYYRWADKRFIGGEGNWSFGQDLGDKNVQKLSPRERTSTWKGRLEEFAVTPAQHSSTMIGKSWRMNTGQPALDEHDMPVPALVPATGKVESRPTAHGIYFQDRWDEALSVDPEFIYLNDWNEWSAGKYAMDCQFLGRKSNFLFVDQYNEEFNRTIAPMKGGYTDNYYMQMIANIRRYKGVREIPANKGYFTSWENTPAEYRDTRGDIVHRDYNGYARLHYTDNLGRNDIVLAKVGVTRKDILFCVETAAALTQPEPENWMLLFIDADKNSATGWHGYDFMVNNGQLLARSGNEWKKAADVKAYIAGNRLVITIPRKALGLKGNAMTFDFKWADNPAGLDSPIGLATGGDTAPNRRFNYRFVWNR